MAKFPITAATKLLDKLKVPYTPLLYDYLEFGALAAAKQLNVDEQLMIKTLVMEDENKVPFIILMHGDNSVSAKKLARQLSVKNISACNPKDAQRYTGYMVGGISPFGTKRTLPILMEKTILTLPTIYINAGRRGFLLQMTPHDLVQVLNPKIVHVAR